MPHARVARTRAQQSARARPADQPGCLKACTRQMHAEGSKRVHGAALLCPLSLFRKGRGGVRDAGGRGRHSDASGAGGLEGACSVVLYFSFAAARCCCQCLCTLALGRRAACCARRCPPRVPGVARARCGCVRPPPLLPRPLRPRGAGRFAANSVFFFRASALTRAMENVPSPGEREDMVATFCSVTGASADEAQQVLAAQGWSLEVRRMCLASARQALQARATRAGRCFRGWLSALFSVHPR